MEWFITRSYLFFFGGIAGWILELFFRRFVSARKWVNPGFLTGPCLPLYGFGLLAFFALASLDWSWAGSSWLGDMIEIAVIGVFLTALEFAAGLIFIKGMKIKLWDYSQRWGNVMGIICPAFSLVWTVAGAIYVLFCHQFVIGMLNWVSDGLFVWTFILGVGYGILAIDFGWSLGLTAKIRKTVNNSKLVVEWDKIKLSFADYQHKLHARSDWIFAFRPKQGDFKSMIDDYLASLNATVAENNRRLAAKLDFKTHRRADRIEKKHGKKGDANKK